MKKTSEKYKDFMRNETTRERIFLKINIGLINQEAQNNASITSNITSTSNPNIFGNNTIDIPYVTYEHKYFKVDGGMIFPPSTGSPTYFNGVISEKLSDSKGNINGEFIQISFPSSVLPLDIKGLTFRFKYFYPTEFEIQWNGRKELFTNDGFNFITDFIFDGVTDFIRIIPKKMNSPYCRFRIENIKFGIGLEFQDDILESTLETYTHPVSNNLSYKELSFTVSDFKGLYDLENPKSSINFMEALQEVDIQMGVEFRDRTVEWIRMEKLQLLEWVSERDTATFKAVDTLFFDNEQYIKGQFYSDGISLYDLAVDVFRDMGLSEEKYFVDSYLKTIKTKNPIPVCLRKEALQIIANAGHSYVSQDIDGKIFILNNFVPDYEIISNDKAVYANLKNIKNGENIEYYATFENRLMPVDGTVKMLPKVPPYAMKTGYVSNSLAGANGVFAKRPLLAIQSQARMKTFGLNITFGLTIATEFIVKTYLENKEVEQLIFENEEKYFSVAREWLEFDRMDIHIVSVQKEHQRVYIDCIKFGDITDYYINNNSFIDTTPKGKLGATIKNFVVSATSYAQSETEEKLVDKEVIYNEGQEIEIISFTDPVYGLRCEGATLLDRGAFFAKIKKPEVKERTKVKIEIFGKKYNVSKNAVSYKINDKGIEQTFENPLVDTTEKAYALAEWIAEDYLRGNKDYSFDWRGDPSIESNDVVYIQNAFIPKMKLRITKNIMKFSGGALNGTIEGRKVI